MSDVAHRLKREAEAAQTLLAMHPELLGNERLKADAIEGETNFVEAVRRTVLRIAKIDAMVTGLESLMEPLAKRKKRLEQQKENLRTALAVALEVAQQPSLECDVATVSLVRGRFTPIITNEAEIPAEFWKRGDPKLDMKALGQALKDKRVIPGVHLSNGESHVNIHDR